MSEMTTAFADSGHGILNGMSTRRRSQDGPPMTLGNMRANGARLLDVPILVVPVGAGHAVGGLGRIGIDPFQCNPDRDRLSSINFRG
jgi:hypothetical protein